MLNIDSISKKDYLFVPIVFTSIWDSLPWMDNIDSEQSVFNVDAGQYEEGTCLRGSLEDGERAIIIVSLRHGNTVLILDPDEVVTGFYPEKLRTLFPVTVDIYTLVRLLGKQMDGISPLVNFLDTLGTSPIADEINRRLNKDRFNKTFIESTPTKID